MCNNMTMAKTVPHTRTSPKRERIVSLHVNTEPTWRGGEQQTLYLLEGLEKRGHPVTLCVQRDAPLVERARDAGIDVLPMRMRGEADPVAMARLAGVIRKRRPEIVHCHTSHAHTLVAAAARLVSRRMRPRILLSRRVDFSIYRHSFIGLNGFKYRLVDQIVAISERIRDVLLEDGLDASRIEVVHSGIDPTRFSVARPCDLRAEFGFPDTTQVIVNVAYFADHKGQRFLVEAAPKILRACPETALLLVGDGELRPALQALAAELGVAERVLFPGFRRDVPEILLGADLYAMPSLLEGLGTSVLDALVCGLPVVAARAGGIPEMIHHGENGLLVPPKDADALAEALIRLLKDPAECERFARAGPETVAERYTVDHMVEGNLRVYERLLAERRTRA
jgi:glycosyltransferase involved in cell wall biosynthesis